MMTLNVVSEIPRPLFKQRKIQMTIAEGFPLIASQICQLSWISLIRCQGHSPVLHCASLLRIIYGVISARSCTRALKNMADLP